MDGVARGPKKAAAVQDSFQTQTEASFLPISNLQKTTPPAQKYFSKTAQS